MALQAAQFTLNRWIGFAGGLTLLAISTATGLAGTVSKDLSRLRWEVPVLIRLRAASIKLVDCAPSKVRLRNGFDDVIRVFCRDVTFTARGFKSYVHFDIWAFDMHVRPLESIGQTAFRCELS